MNKIILSVCLITVFTKNCNSQANAGLDTNKLKDININWVDREASFPGGSKAWKTYLDTSIRYYLPFDNQAPTGVYNVAARFIIKKDGNIDSIVPNTHFGYGMEEELIRVLKKSPRWISASREGQPAISYYYQSLTFTVSE